MRCYFRWGKEEKKQKKMRRKISKIKYVLILWGQSDYHTSASIQKVLKYSLNARTNWWKFFVLWITFCLFFEIFTQKFLPLLIFSLLFFYFLEPYPFFSCHLLLRFFDVLVSFCYFVVAKKKKLLNACGQLNSVSSNGSIHNSQNIKVVLTPRMLSGLKIDPWIRHFERIPRNSNETPAKSFTQSCRDSTELFTAFDSFGSFGWRR